MDFNSILQIMLLVKSGIIGLGACYYSLKSKQQQSHAELVQKIQDVTTTQLVTTTNLNSKIAQTKNDLTSVVSAVQGVLPAVQDLAESVQKSQSDIASIASSVGDTVSALKSGGPSA